MISRNSHSHLKDKGIILTEKVLPSGVFRKSPTCFLYVGQFLAKSMVKVRHRAPISSSLSISRARSPADWARALRRRDREYLRSIRSAVFTVSNSNSSKPSLALRHAFLVNLSKSKSKSPSLKARTVCVCVGVGVALTGKCREEIRRRPRNCVPSPGSHATAVAIISQFAISLLSRHNQRWPLWLWGRRKG
uniref:Uncharacterized protein LOC107414937 n=1 Tax=Rhizophora mucronata TaxID=61149 RepID=A0A2P2KTA0_RHIMU